MNQSPAQYIVVERKGIWPTENPDNIILPVRLSPIPVEKNNCFYVLDIKPRGFRHMGEGSKRRNLKVTRKSLFSHFANLGILAGWLDRVFWGMTSRFKLKLLRSSSRRVVALKSAIYKSTSCLDLPMALPISEDVNWRFVRSSEEYNTHN